MCNPFYVFFRNVCVILTLYDEMMAGAIHPNDMHATNSIHAAHNYIGDIFTRLYMARISSYPTHTHTHLHIHTDTLFNYIRITFSTRQWILNAFRYLLWLWIDCSRLDANKA